MDARHEKNTRSLQRTTTLTLPSRSFTATVSLSGTAGGEPGT